MKKLDWTSLSPREQTGVEWQACQNIPVEDRVMLNESQLNARVDKEVNKILEGGSDAVNAAVKAHQKMLAKQQHASGETWAQREDDRSIQREIGMDTPEL